VPGVKPAAPLPAPIRPVETKEVSQARKPIEILKDDPVAPPSSPLKAMVSPPVRSGTPDATHTHRYQLSIGDSIVPGRPSETPGAPPVLTDVRPVRPDSVLSAKRRWPVDPIPWKDPLKLTRDEEAKLGKAVHEVIRRHHHVVGEGAETAFLNHLYRLSVPLQPKDLECNFY